MSTPSSPGILAELSRADSAETFFTLLGVDYDPKVVNVMRLHILRRMGQYLASEDFSGQPEEAVRQRCSSVLAQAYADFLASSPLEERVFKVLKDAVAPPKPRTLISLTPLE
ncbi:nitrogenase-stabilizing/protective protein NifW [Azorhizobium oxalatiphilum]|uniref:Nitrogenase-stabilizing/protective protein NifW n=2 Tax=Azorhizobium oxalatiphilum TaxID=980631 RepID=A0A917C294_9HYPH|nr:nitrogenase-stabilizing/protective protein NifW [Azorhizobium oxalatiphilum]